MCHFGTGKDLSVSDKRRITYAYRCKVIYHSYEGPPKKWPNGVIPYEVDPSISTYIYIYSYLIYVYVTMVYVFLHKFTNMVTSGVVDPK